MINRNHAIFFSVSSKISLSNQYFHIIDHNKYSRDCVSYPIVSFDELSNSILLTLIYPASGKTLLSGVAINVPLVLTALGLSKAHTQTFAHFCTKTNLKLCKIGLNLPVPQRGCQQLNTYQPL